MTSHPKHTANARTLLSLTCLVFALAAASCQSPQSPRPRRTIRYDGLGPIPIASPGRAGIQQLVTFFTQTNPDIDPHQLRYIAYVYISEAAAEGINHDVAFCQMVHETNYLRFGGDVDPSQNNFCGLGATGGVPGLSFPSARIGIRAHIQHLKAYADIRPLSGPCVDPRFEKVRRGSAPRVDDLTGKWATDPLYGQKLKQKLSDLEQHLQIDRTALIPAASPAGTR